ncbi:MAG: hypothetical protein QXV37_04340, partial [Candidatus Jordarchaeaceae archaeon]
VPTGYSLGIGITLLRFSNWLLTTIVVLIFFLVAGIGLYRRVIREYGPKSDKYVGKIRKDTSKPFTKEQS